MAEKELFGNSEQLNDTISRQAAIDALADMHCKSDEDGYVWIIRSDAWARIDALPYARRWIPVTEKPIEGGQYIVTLKDDKEVWTDIAEWNPTFGGRWQAEFFDCEYRDIDNVVAWQPLPTPYREGGLNE